MFLHCKEARPQQRLFAFCERLFALGIPGLKWNRDACGSFPPSLLLPCQICLSVPFQDTSASCCPLLLQSWILFVYISPILPGER
jgi:hypothetical protein